MLGVVVIAAFASLGAGCGSSNAGEVPAGASTSTARVTAGSSESPQPPGSAAPGTGASTRPGTPDVERVLDDIETLAVSIGPRPAGTQAERDAAAYLAGQLEDAGYDVSVEEFTFEAERDSSFVSVDEGYLSAYAMRGAPNGDVEATAVFVGLGQLADLAGADLQGKVVIFDRGVITFRDKALAAQAGGALAAIIVNHDAGPFVGALGDTGDILIPVLAVSGDDGAILREAVGRVVTVHAEVGREPIVSQNVMGNMGGRSCHGYLGAHYDSVAQGPGANDNASGVAVVLEIARVQPVQGLCILFFGAEELGLYGSRHYVAEHLAGMARFMINVDMAGRLDGPIVVGDTSLTNLILSAAAPTSLRAGDFPPFASSDHVPFSSVGVPAVTLNAGDDPALHTPQDTIERIERGALQTFLSALDASVDALVERHPGSLAR